MKASAWRGTPVRFDKELKAWLVTDISSARVVLGRHDLYSVAAYQSLANDLSDIARFIVAEREHHRLLRKVMARTFAMRQIKSLEAEIFRPAAEDLADTLLSDSPTDLQVQFVTPYTRRVMYGIIGVDQDSGDELAAAFKVAHMFIVDKRDQQRGIAALSLLRAKAAEVCAASRDDRLPYSLLGQAEHEDWLAGGLDLADLICLIMPLVEAAAIKAHRDLTATVLRRVAAMPAAEQRRLIQTSAFAQAAAEAARMQHDGFLPRVALADTTLGGQEIRAGDKVYVMLAEVGMDPDAFQEPGKFCPWRADGQKAVSFGIGRHRCVGENIAKQIAVSACKSLTSRWEIVMLAEQDTAFHVSLRPWS